MRQPSRERERERELALRATTNVAAYADQDLIIIAVPTNYDEKLKYFDTSIVESVLNVAKEQNPDALYVIKSTIPVGYTDSLTAKYPELKIIFSPEFLREAHALEDNLHPSRIIVGARKELRADAHMFANLLAEAALEEQIPILVMSPTEAESVKLFANTYLAMRVAFFNELDTYAELKNLSAKNIIQGTCLDPRIGMFYNNPSFGYGGYCLPKDTKQLRENFSGVPQNIISAIVASNDTRKRFIANQILNKKPSTVGIFRLTMKKDSDNFRASSVQDIMRHLRDSGVNVVIYEPTLVDSTFEGYPVIPDVAQFIETVDIIIANRHEDILESAKHKVYTRDIFFNN